MTQVLDTNRNYLSPVTPARQTRWKLNIGMAHAICVSLTNMHFFQWVWRPGLPGYPTESRKLISYLWLANHRDVNLKSTLTRLSVFFRGRQVKSLVQEKLLLMPFGLLRPLTGASFGGWSPVQVPMRGFYLTWTIWSRVDINVFHNGGLWPIRCGPQSARHIQDDFSIHPCSQTRHMLREQSLSCR